MRNSSKLLLAAGVLLIGFSAGKSAYAQEQSLAITGNGSGSVNETSTVQKQTTYVTQSNESTLTNNIVVNADTGHNQASSNANGTSVVATGNITSDVLVNNAVGTNDATSCCVGSSDPLTANVSENGSHSSNSVSHSQTNTNVLNQTNSTNLVNNVAGSLNTGGNSTSSNVGGPNRISTGGVFSHIGINNILNSNTASLGCCNLTNAEPPSGGTLIPNIPVAAILQTPGQVLAASKAAVLPNTGAGDTMWIMSLASLVLMFGFIVRKSAAALLVGALSA